MFLTFSREIMIEAIKNISKDRSTFIFVSSVKITKSMKNKIVKELRYNCFLQRTSKNDVYVYRMEKISKNSKL